MDLMVSVSYSVLQKLLAGPCSKDELLELVPKFEFAFRQIPHNDVTNIARFKLEKVINETHNHDELIRRMTLMILEILAETGTLFQAKSEEIIRLCINNVIYYFESRHFCVPMQFKRNELLKWYVGRLLMKPWRFSDPHLPLEIMCLKYTLNINLSSYFPDFWSGVDMEVCFVIMIHQINVDKYLSLCLDDKLLNFRILERIMNRFKYDNIWVSIPSNSNIFKDAAERLEKKSLLKLIIIDFCSKIIELLSQALLFDIKNESYETIHDIVRSSRDVATFFTVYFKIRVAISKFQIEKHSLVEESNRSAIATVTNCIFLLQSKLEGLSKSPLDQTIIQLMGKVRDHMTKEDLGSDPRISIEQFLVERSLGNFNTSYTKGLYNVSTNIKKICNKTNENAMTKAPKLHDILDLDRYIKQYEPFDNIYVNTDD